MRVISCAVAMTRTQQATGSSSECKFHGGGALRCACRSDGRSSRDNARDHQFLHAQPLQPICGDHLPCGAHLVVMLGRVQSVDSECLRYAAVFVTQLIPVLSPYSTCTAVRARSVPDDRLPRRRARRLLTFCAAPRGIFGWLAGFLLIVVRQYKSVQYDWSTGLSSLFKL